MKRFAAIASVVLAMIVAAGSASALELESGVAKKQQPPPPAKKETPPAEAHENFWDVGVDLGFPVYSYLGSGLFSLGHSANVNFHGTGQFSFPFLGAHFSLYPSKNWYIQIGLGWIRQTGLGKFGTVRAGDLPEPAYKAAEAEFNGQMLNWGLNAFRLDAGVFKLFGDSRIVRPKAGIGVAVYYLSFFDRDNKPNDTWAGWTVGPFVVAGVDFDVYHNKQVGVFFVGLNVRGDIVYTVAPLVGNGTKKGSDATLLWIPVTVYVTAGFRF